MLAAFKAQPIHELKQRDKSKVESLLGYGDRLLVGLNTGALRIYRINESNEPSESNGEVPPSPTKSKPVELLREEEKFSKKPVQQLAIIKEANILVSLSDTYVSLHDLQTYQLVERLERTKGASCFTVTSNVVEDPETKVLGLVSRIAVGTKRKILCWTWQDLELSQDVTEINLEASVKSLVWANGTRLITGMDPGFSVVDILSQEIIPINKNVVKTGSAADVNTGELVGVRFGAVSSSGMGYMGMGSWVPKPMATPLTGDEVLLAKDVNTLFVNTDGNALEKRQVPWALAPEAIGYSYPYLLALNPPEKGTLQIRNPDTLSLLQTISVPGATFLHVPQPNISLAHAGKGFLVASDRTIWRMNALSYDSQLTVLVERQRFDEALSLLNLLEDTLIEDKPGRVREVMIQKATALFHQQKYMPALDLFTDAEASPDRVIALYPKSIACELSTVEERSEDEPAPTENGHDDAGKPEPVTPQKGMLGKLRGSARKADSDTASIKSPARADTDNMSTRNKAAAKAPDRPLEGDDLKFAVRCLGSYLARARMWVQKHLTSDGTLKEKPPVFDPETGKPPFHNLLPQSLTGKKAEDAIDWEAELLKIAQLVDTTLFRAYMLSQPTLTGSLFRLDNFCEPEVVQSALYEGERYNELIDFLHGKKLHREALEMLAKFGRGDADGEVPPGMQGPGRTVAYLKQLPPELVDLILEFVRWPLEEKPDIGMDVFLADSDNAERLPRRKVLEFLASIDGRLETQYLEHILNELGDETDDFHQQLVDLYLVRLKQPDIDEDERVELKSKLEAFLTNSHAYSLNKTLRQLPTDDPAFYESRAIVLSAMEQHEQALSIYVFQIQDYTKAEAYCNKTYLKQQAHEEACLVNNTAAHTHEKQKPLFKAVQPEGTFEQPNIFAILLGLYLNPRPNEEKRWPQALELLSKHGARLPASSTLKFMPDDLAVQQLQDYFCGRIRNATSILREEMIVKSLESVRQANKERLLLLGPDKFAEEKPMGRNRRVRIGPEDHCKVCHKRFGASAVRVYPDDSVVHYGCIGKGGVQKQKQEGISGLGLGRLRRGVEGWS